MVPIRSCLALLLLAVPALLQAEEPRGLTAIDLIGLPRVGDPRLSPDGRQVLYTVSEADWKANKRTSHIHRVGVDRTGAVQLTNGATGESSPRWSPDGATIAFLAKRGDDEHNQLYLIPNAGGEARRLTRHASAVSRIAWAPDGASLYFTAPEPKTAEEKARDKAKDDVYAYDEEYKQLGLWRVAVADGAEVRLAGGDFSVTAYDVSRDGRRIAHQRGPTPLFGDVGRGEIWVMDASGANARRLTTNEVPEGTLALSPDGERVAFTCDCNASFDFYYPSRLFVADVAGGAPRLVSPDFVPDVDAVAWSKDGRTLWAVANLGVRDELFGFDVASGRARALTDGRHSLGAWSYSAAADAHVLVAETAESPGEVQSLAREGALQPVTRVHADFARRFRLPRLEKLEWKGKDGVTVEGLLYYPLDYQAGRRYPLAVQTHGGPQSSDQYGLGGSSSYIPLLAAKGYAVLRPNYRGSTGYGERFVRDMLGAYFRNAHLDVMAGVDHVIAMGVADPDRLVKMGWSAGGHMTNKIITFTDRFKAACSGAGAANWISMYGQSDVRVYRTPWFGGTPWQKGAPIDVYWENSPLKYVANVRTPTLFLVGEKDPRVPMPQSVEMYRALKANGIQTRLWVAPREPHGWQELRHQLFKINVELDWFERHLGRPYTWEKAPPSEGAGASDAVAESARDLRQ
jgi:dipeptidyl aminopeptidase/acylaminoacyl peptidase